MDNLFDEEDKISQRILKVYHQILKIDKTNPILQMVRVQDDKVTLSDNAHRVYEGPIKDKCKYVLIDLEEELKKYNQTKS